MPRELASPRSHAAKFSNPGRHGAGPCVGGLGFADKTGGTDAAIFRVAGFLERVQSLQAIISSIRARSVGR